MLIKKAVPKECSTVLDWIEGARIYIGYSRYGALGGHGFVVATAYEGNDELGLAIDQLDGGDIDALEAANKIEKLDCLYANHPNPAIAMQMLMDKLATYHQYICEVYLNGPSRY